MSSFADKLKLVTGCLGCGAGIGIGIGVGLALKSSFNTLVAPVIIGTIAGVVAIPIAAAALYAVTMCTVVVCSVIGLVVMAGPLLDKIERGGSSSRKAAVPATSAVDSFSVKPYTPFRDVETAYGSGPGHTEVTPLTAALTSGSRVRVVM
jgi:hypothetical protein